MKLINKYDLMSVVNQSNGIMEYDKIIAKKAKVQVLASLISIGLIKTYREDIPWDMVITNFAFFTTLFSGIEIFCQHLIKDRMKELAYSKLISLSLQLSDLNIHTTPDLLKESKIDLIEYKFWRTENKYIIIPTYNEFIGEGKISLLQEHEIGTDKYILSVGSPSKSYKLVPLFNH